jgi:polar amino acid transport system substrate-binding protein
MLAFKEFRMQLPLRAMLPLLLLLSISSRAANKDLATPGTLVPGVLRLCISTAFPPALFEDRDGRPAGYDLTFLKEFAEQQRLKLVYDKYPFDGLWLRPGRDECDIAAAGISMLSSRTGEGVAWSRPYFGVQRTLLIREADAGTFRTIADFGGHKIGFVSSSMAEADARARAPNNTILVGYTSAIEGLEDLKAGKIDAFGDGSITSGYFANTNPGLMVIDSHSLAPQEVFAFPVRAASGVLNQLDEYIEHNHDRYGH